MDKMTPERVISKLADLAERHAEAAKHYADQPSSFGQALAWTQEKAIASEYEAMAETVRTLQGERDRLVAMMTAGIALIDAANAGCPVRQDRRGAKGPMCPKCGATASQQCGPVAGTEYELVQDIRAALRPEPSTEKEGEPCWHCGGPEGDGPPNNATRCRVCDAEWPEPLGEGGGL